MSTPAAGLAARRRFTWRSPPPRSADLRREWTSARSWTAGGLRHGLANDHAHALHHLGTLHFRQRAVRQTDIYPDRLHKLALLHPHCPVPWRRSVSVWGAGGRRVAPRCRGGALRRRAELWRNLIALGLPAQRGIGYHEHIVTTAGDEPYVRGQVRQQLTVCVVGGNLDRVDH